MFLVENNPGLVIPVRLVSSSNHFGTNQESTHTLDRKVCNFRYYFLYLFFGEDGLFFEAFGWAFISFLLYSEILAENLFVLIRGEM